jgi:hypothetical protein
MDTATVVISGVGLLALAMYLKSRFRESREDDYLRARNRTHDKCVINNDKSACMAFSTDFDNTMMIPGPTREKEDGTYGY